MKVFTTDKIRNVVVLGHSGAGKTSLVSAMNGIATASKQRMTEPAATTQMLVQPILWDDHKINILDVPGAFDFVGEIEEAVGVADAAIIVISGKNGVENGTRKAWAMCEKYHLPRIVYVSDMDIDDVSFKNVVLGLQELYGKCIAPFHFPLRENEEFVGYVNVIQERAKRWQSDGTVVKSEVPEYSMENLSIYREALMEAVAETSEEFLDRYFAGETFSENEIRQALRVNVSEGTIVPVMMGSNTMERGMYTLLADIIKYLPSPDQRSATGMNVLTQELFEANYNFAKAKTAYVFKTIMDPFIGKYSLFKVMSGVIKSDDNLYDQVKGQEIRISKLYVMKGSKAEEVEELHAGDVGALSKVSGLQTSTTLSTKATPVLYPATAISTPYCAMRYFAADAKEDDKLTQSLLKLAEEDRTLRVENDSENRQTLVYGISEQHLQAVADRLRAKYNVEMQLESTKVAYRETIRGSADVEFKVSPSGNLTSAYEFEETVVGGAVPKNFFPAVEKGIAEGTQAGPLAGYPVVGIHVNLYDGSSHSVDSSEAAFKTAATMALKDALMKADPVLLEPIASLQVRVPEDKVGDVMGELSKRRARIMGMNPEQENGRQRIEAEIPYATLYGIGTTLHSITGGEAEYSYEFLKYEVENKG